MTNKFKLSNVRDVDAAVELFREEHPDATIIATTVERDDEERSTVEIEYE